MFGDIAGAFCVEMSSCGADFVDDGPILTNVTVNLQVSRLGVL